MTSEEKEKQTKEIKKLVDEKLRKELTNQFDMIEKKDQIDYLNIYRMCRYKNPKLFKFYEDNQKGFLQDLQYSISVDVKFY